jgi:hypothetical protein
MIMVLGRTPGPEGRRGFPQATDTGTLAKTLSHVPGPVGLFLKPKGPTNPQKTVAPKNLGITINESSKISAKDWVDKIKASNAPEYFKQQINTKDNTIFVNNLQSAYPTSSDLGRRGPKPWEWVSDWLAAFAVAEWEITTACLELTGKTDAKGRFIVGVLRPDLSKGDSIEGFTIGVQLTKTIRTFDASSLEVGYTLTDGLHLKSGRKLIVIANRITVNLGKGTVRFDREDSEVCETWFHEISCHAGRVTQNLSADHGDDYVEFCAVAVEAMIFPAKTTADPTVAKVRPQVEAFFKS